MDCGVGRLGRPQGKTKVCMCGWSGPHSHRRGVSAVVVVGSPHPLSPDIDDDLALASVACRALRRATGAPLGLLLLDPTSPTVEALLVLLRCRPRFVLVHNANLDHHAGWVARHLSGPERGRYRYLVVSGWRAEFGSPGV